MNEWMNEKKEEGRRRRRRRKAKRGRKKGNKEGKRMEHNHLFVDDKTRRQGNAPTCGRSKYSLLGGVRELIFPSAIVTLLYTGVRPQILDRFHVRALERRHRLEVYAPHEFRFFLETRGSLVNAGCQEKRAYRVYIYFRYTILGVRYCLSLSFNPPIPARFN